MLPLLSRTVEASASVTVLTSALAAYAAWYDPVRSMKNQPPVRLDASSYAAALDWLDGRLVFERTPLSEVIAELTFSLGEPLRRPARDRLRAVQHGKNVCFLLLLSKSTLGNLHGVDG